MLNRESFIEWAAHWVGGENHERFKAAFAAELDHWTPATAIPSRENCPACAKVLRHPGEGYACAWHDWTLTAAGRSQST